MKPKRALVREPGAKFLQCISSNPLRHTIDITRARKQHNYYCHTLSELGLEVVKLDRDDMHPDSCFIEDTAIIQSGKALIARMAKSSRRGEELPVEAILQDYLSVKRAKAPATIEGGDVIHLPNRLICGLTQRTNKTGMEVMTNWFDVHTEIITDLNIIHLKSHVTYLGKNTMITTLVYASHPVLNEFKVLIVPDDEAYAANTLTIGESVLLPKNYPKSKEILEEAGFEVICLDMSEFAKCEGALTCLSLLF